MLKYIGKRLIMLIPVILVTSFLIFWAMSLTGGDLRVITQSRNRLSRSVKTLD